MAGSLSRNRLKWLSNTGLLRSVRGPGLAAEPLLSIANNTRFSASLSATCPGYAPKANGTENILTSLGAGMRAIVAQYFLRDANRSSVRGALLAQAKSLSAEYARAANKSARGRAFFSAPSFHHRHRNSRRPGTSRDPTRAARRPQRCPRWRRRDPAEYSGANQQWKIRDSPC